MLKDNLLIRVIKGHLNIPAALPANAQIEITNLCNLDCPMCFKNFIKVPPKHMDFEVFKQVVDKLIGVRLITLCGYGETMCYPKIFEAIRYCKERGFEVELTSNATLLDDSTKLKGLISSGLDSVTFSFESISRINPYCHDNISASENVKELIKTKRDLASPTPEITLQTLMMKGKEADLFELIRWGAENGVDRINVARFEQFNTLKHIEKPNLKEEKKLFKEFSRLRKKLKIRIDCLQDQFYTGIKGFLYNGLKYFTAMDKNCIRLYDFIYINVDGDVRPCCALVECKMDSLLNRGLNEIWTSKRYNNFRKSYKNVGWCSRCDFAKLKQINLK